MKSFFRPLLPVICLLTLLACGCAAANKGLSGNTMYGDGLADTAVTPINGMVPVASGSYLGSFPSDNIVNPPARISYAIYGDISNQSVKRHAHVVFAEMTTKSNYLIMPETFTRANEIALRNVKIDRRDWTEHTFYEKRQGDWFTEYWDINGYVTPQVWFGKRWSRTYDDAGRVVVEYREPLPECARINDGSVLVIMSNVMIDMPTPECRREVEAILERADQAFSMRRPATVNTSMPVPAQVLTVTPDREMDLERHVGHAEFMPKANVD